MSRHFQSQSEIVDGAVDVGGGKWVSICSKAEACGGYWTCSRQRGRTNTPSSGQPWNDRQPRQIKRARVAVGVLDVGCCVFAVLGVVAAVVAAMEVSTQPR